MTDRSGEDLCDLRLTGGSIKLTARPSQSASVSRKYTAKLYSRPASALPRLCNGLAQEEFSSMKNDQRPYSADFVVPKLHSAKSKDTLTDGSFESISVSVDLQLPSSNLFKELLEEDIEAWRRNEDELKTDRKEAETDNPSSIKTISSSSADESDVKEISKNGKTTKKEESSDFPCRNRICEDLKSDRSSSVNAIADDIIVEEEAKTIMSERKEHEDLKFTYSDFKYTMTPGLTSKPPLPKKTVHSPESETFYEQAIYDFFTIKYNLDKKGPQILSGVAEKPITDIIPIEDDHFRSNASNAEELANYQEELKVSTSCTRTIGVSNETKETKKELGVNSMMITDWLKEITTENISEKNIETDENKNVQNPNGNTVETSECEFPLLSEIDIEELFKDGNSVSNSVLSRDENFKVDSKRNNKNKEKKTTNKKRTKPMTVGKLQLTGKSVTEKNLVGKKMYKENNTINRAKFEAKPLKPAAFPAFGSREDDNVETWIGKEAAKAKKKFGFDALIDEVEDLKQTTELINKQIPVEIVPFPEENGNSEQFEEIKTIIETLEHQDKASQNNIRTMKRIVTTELSNSLILNENEENLSFRRDEITQIGEETLFNEADSHAQSENNIIEEDEQQQKITSNNHSDQIPTSKPCENHQENRIKNPCSIEVSKSSGNATVHNYRELVSFLDEMDRKCTKTLEVAKERMPTNSKLTIESSLFDTVPRVEDLLTHNPEELASFIIDLSLRVKDKASCISLLQNELSTLRDKILNQTKQADANLRQKLREQKEETERIAKRHQKFIDQLMEEKKTLARRCEELVAEMTAMEDKYVSNMKSIEHKHQVEIQKMRDMQAASEKLRRERWIEGRTQKIKEMAVKSIEPEVERMEKRHQEELSNLRSVHKREIEELELRAARKLQEHSEALRDQLIKDREKALAHERDVMRLRYEKLVESEERNYQEQRRRLLVDHANRVAECEEREAQAVNEKERIIKQMQDEFEEKLQAAKRRHANEIKLVKETDAIEMGNWKNTFRKEQTALLMEKETAIRRECRKERDKEIEMVIDRLENEANKARSQIEETAENRIKRIKEKYDAEIRDLEMLERDAQNKYCDARAKLMEYEEVILTLRTSMRQLENQVTEQNVKCANYEAEREEIGEAIRKEYVDKVRSLEGEVEELRTSADKQVEQLYSRVRVSLARKDEILAELTNDHKALKEKCSYLENIIEQQRKEFLIH